MDIFLWALMSAMCIMLLVIDRLRQKDLAKVISAHKDLCSTYEDHIQTLREIIMEQENMTTNTEHRRRETDKIDQVCIKYQLEKANARIAELEKNQQWISPKDQMPPAGKNVLIRQSTGSGNKAITIVGHYITQYFEEAFDVEEWHELNPENETYYNPAGWYENQFNWDEYSSIGIPDGAVIAWMPLPPPSTETKET